MRKRAQFKGTVQEPAHIAEKKTVEKKHIKLKKNHWTAIALVGIFLMVLLLNTYFNVSSGDTLNDEGSTVSEKFFLSGPDPYYNMRLVEKTLETGQYPYYTEDDPLLNYPKGRSGGRPPLLNMAAIGFSKLLVPFMDDTDAIGYAMQFVPALFGALIIFPVYLIGKQLFGRKEGLVAALLLAIIPIHIASGHGSAYSLFDHDSLNLLIFFLTYLFLIRSIMEKNANKSIIYALLSGVSLGALSLTWTEARFLYMVIVVYATVQLIIDIYRNKTDLSIPRTFVIVMFTGYLIYLPLIFGKYGGFTPELQFYSCLIVAVYAGIYFVLNKIKIPWVISLPALFLIGGGGVLLLANINTFIASFPFLSPLTKISQILKGIGIYGNKVSLTIAEAGTYNISRSWMSYGPVLFFLTVVGLGLLIFYYLRDKEKRRDYLFVIVGVLVSLWLTSTAGRFLNDLVPFVAILAAWMAVYFVMARIDYKEMFRNIRGAGGGLHGLRRGIKFMHIFGIIFVVLILLIPNAFLAFDAAVPGVDKVDFFGEEYSGAYGLSSYKERYWTDAFGWLKEQDTEITDPNERPAFISWWDYGFYEVASGAHPTVADNFQDGIPPAANFHTATSENEAVAVMIIRLVEGSKKHNNGEIPSDIVSAFNNHLEANDTNDIVSWINDPYNSPSYGKLLGDENDTELLGKEYVVGEQYAENAAYHDVTELLLSKLDDEGLTMLYHDVQEATGYSIRYYGVEGYDESIFNIFAFLGDKSLYLLTGDQDDFLQVKYLTESGKELSRDELEALTDEELTADPIAITDSGMPSTKRIYKPDYYKTMFFRTYVGDTPMNESGRNSQSLSQFPCWGMRHFSAEFCSQWPYPGATRSAVVIAKYYEGAKISGNAYFEGEPLNVQIVVQKNSTNALWNITLPIDHDTSDTDENGTFAVIAPAGEIILQVRRYPELGFNAFSMKDVYFNGEEGTAMAPISDDESMRMLGTEFERYVNISVEPGSLGGYVYEDNDDNGSYNASFDTPLSDVTVTLFEVTEFDASGQPINFNPQITVTTDEDGYYNSSGLQPGYYIIRAILDDFVIHEDYQPIISGENTLDVAKPKLSNVEGTVFFDENDNGAYDSGEEMSDVELELTYTKVDGQTKSVDSYTTTATGSYSFNALLPGNYNVKAEKANAAGYLDYSFEGEITLNENKTTSFNVSMDYATITVSGNTLHSGSPVEDITVNYEVDLSIENNTAESGSATSDNDGSYEVLLKPGYYNISVEKKEGRTIVYTYTGSLHLTLGQGVAAKTIALTKESVTVQGSTISQGAPIDNLTITFEPNEAIENNTAVMTTAMADTIGAYDVEVTPGNYLITVNETITTETNQTITYVYSEAREIQPAGDTITLDIVVTRVEA